jgi:hypothetical protein
MVHNQTFSISGSRLSKATLLAALQRLPANAKPEALVAANALGRCGVATLPACDETWLAY